MRLAAALLALTLPVCAMAQTPEESWGCASAAYFGPTDEYRHGVLGDDLEYKGLYMSFYRDDSQEEIDEVRITLPDGQVFEDLSPRCGDFNKDGAPDPVTVISDAKDGARLAIFIRGEIAYQTPPIGRGYRWLAPAGIADFNGDGVVDVAYVETPHIGGTLRIWSFRDGKFIQIANIGGVSNHKIGQAFISGGVRDCGEGPELVVAMADWSRLLRAWMVDGVLEVEPISRSTGRSAWARAMECEL